MIEELYDAVIKALLTGETGGVLGQVGALRQTYRDQVEEIKTLRSEIAILRSALEPVPLPPALQRLEDEVQKLKELERTLKKMNGDG
jgi:regulator of replication initiation timing